MLGKQKLQHVLAIRRHTGSKVFASKTPYEKYCARICKISSREDSGWVSCFCYAQNWDCIRKLIRKQNFLLIQGQLWTLGFHRGQHPSYTRKAIKWYEKCGNGEGEHKLREQLIRLCRWFPGIWNLFLRSGNPIVNILYPKVEYGHVCFWLKDRKRGSCIRVAAILTLYRRNGYGAFEKGSCLEISIVESLWSASVQMPGAIQKRGQRGCSGWAHDASRLLCEMIISCVNIMTGSLTLMMK